MHKWDRRNPVNEHRHSLLDNWRDHVESDGVKQVMYSLVGRKNYGCFEKFMVNIGKPPTVDEAKLLFNFTYATNNDDDAYQKSYQKMYGQQSNDKKNIMR